jgi:low temperature requirement protein LtrA
MTQRAHSAVRRMVARDPHEPHRVATPLELLFDLCFVVAVAQASSSLHHGLDHGEIAHCLISFALVFFAIWWAWMNFTWFASAYDADDVPYRLKVLVQIFGVLVIAAGVPRAFDRGDFSVVTLGYAIMRAGQIAQWLRAAKSVPAHRQTALRYALGLAVIQVAWILLACLKPSFWIAVFALLVVWELLIPIWAERYVATPWHPHHIAERYGLLTLIVLGESVLSATVSIQAAIDAGHISVTLGVLIFAEVILLFGMWWIYFDATPRQLSRTSREAFLWGYGHLFIFAAAAAVGAGLSVCTDQFTGAAHLSEQLVSSMVGVPVAVYVLGLWAIHLRDRRPAALKVAFLLGAVFLIALVGVPWPWSILGMSAIVVALVISLRLAPPNPQH